MMRIPAIRGIIERRFLINYRVETSVLEKLLPKPFKPKLHYGYGIAGICLIKLKRIRPTSFPIPFGINSENAAHRIAVEWSDKGKVKSGVYIPRRDTNSVLNHITSGKLFSSPQHLARFSVIQNQSMYEFEMNSNDRLTHIKFSGSKCSDLPKISIFKTQAESSNFFESGSIGYAPLKNHTWHDGIKLKTDHWEVSPFSIESVHSSYFEDTANFPKNSIHFDHALLMENIPHEWHALKPLSN